MLRTPKLCVFLTLLRSTMKGREAMLILLAEVDQKRRKDLWPIRDILVSSPSIRRRVLSPEEMAVWSTAYDATKAVVESAFSDAEREFCRALRRETDQDTQVVLLTEEYCRRHLHSTYFTYTGQSLIRRLAERGCIKLAAIVMHTLTRKVYDESFQPDNVINLNDHRKGDA